MGGAEDSATIERALDALVDPAVRMCVAAAGEKDAALRRQAAPAPAWDRAVFVLNCLTYLVDTLAPYPCAARKRAELDSTVEARVLELIEEHVRVFPFTLSPSHIHLYISFLLTSFILGFSMRLYCAIQVCTTPFTHVNIPQMTYVTTSTLSLQACCRLCRNKKLTSHTTRSGTTRARVCMCPTDAPQRANILRALARLARCSTCTTTCSAHGPCSACTSTPCRTAAPRQRVFGTMWARA